jgi:hypothetical protein
MAGAEARDEPNCSDGFPCKDSWSFSEDSTTEIKIAFFSSE